MALYAFNGQNISLSDVVAVTNTLTDYGAVHAQSTETHKERFFFRISMTGGQQYPSETYKTWPLAEAARVAFLALLP